jgi:hypothetical protein
VEGSDLVDDSENANKQTGVAFVSEECEEGGRVLALDGGPEVSLQYDEVIGNVPVLVSLWPLVVSVQALRTRR